MPGSSAKPGGKRVTPKKKGAKGYKLPDPIPIGEVIQDVSKLSWIIGPSIGVGGFGEIYSAAKESSSPKKKSEYPFVVKIEPHDNGPLFVEMHFYMRVAKPELINEWMLMKEMKSLGIPRFFGSGSHECNGIKYRFVVMERFGEDLWTKFLGNNRQFPSTTVMQIGIQVLHALEYIHSKSYVHADIKGGNLLMGIEKGKENQVFLVDFGLASRYQDGDFKPDPKRAHNGTIEYTSRDAHEGVPTMRGDLEILGYNMLQWCTSSLPWELNLSNPVVVQKEKVKYMNDIPALMTKCFGTRKAPEALVNYFHYVASMTHNQQPDYNKCRAMLSEELKKDGGSVDGKLNFTVTEKIGKSARARGHKAATEIPAPENESAVASSTKGKKSPAKKGRKVTATTSIEKKERKGRPALARKAKANPESGNGSSPEHANGKTEAGGKLVDASTADEDIDDSSEGIITSKKNVAKGTAKTVIKPKAKTTSSWENCPTVLASRVTVPGQYKRLSEERTDKPKKQRK